MKNKNDKKGIRISMSFASILLLCFISFVNADQPFESPPAQEWNESFDGDVKDVISTVDGGYIVALTYNTSQSPYSDIKIVKISAVGETEWVKFYNGPGDGNDQVCNCKQTSDGGYIIFGNTEEAINSRSYDAWFFKINSLGNIQWNQIIGNANNDEKINEGIITDGGYIAVGSIEVDNGADEKDVWVVKINANQKLWEKSYDLLQSDTGKSICKTDDGYVLSCDACYFKLLPPQKYTKVYAVRINENGNKIDENYYPPSTENNYFYISSSIVQMSDGNFVVAGQQMVLSLSEQYGHHWLWKIDRNLNTEIGKIIGSGSDQIDLLNDICINTGDDLYAIGTHIAFSGNSAIELYKFDTNLNSIWDAIISDGKNGVSIENTLDHSIIISGIFNAGDQSMSKVIKYDGEIDVEIPLYTGWNLITTSVDNGWSASNLKNELSCCQYVVRWKADSQSWSWYTGQGFDFQLDLGNSYFVYMTCNEVLSVSGIPIESIDVSLKQGWNLLGWYPEYGTTASNIRDCIPGCEYVVRWKADSQSWSWYTGQGFDFQINQGMGFFVYVTEESIWHGDC